MSGPELSQNLFKKIVDFLIPEMGDSGPRKSLVEIALHGSPVLQKIQWDGAARAFTVQLVRVLNDFGNISPGRPALVALLEDVKSQVGADRQAVADDLIVQINTPSASQEIKPPDKTFEGGDHYIFLSYARPDSLIADKVESYLSGAGVRVFRDKSDIHPGMNWDKEVEDALRQCRHMVLLLSANSMPYRKEVHREWFYFDQEKKPIYPLFIAECDLHSRMRAYNYIDARNDLQAALNRILDELGSEYSPPAPSTEADKISVFEKVEIDERDLPRALQDLERAVRDPMGSVVLSQDQAIAIRDHKPADINQYRLGRIAEWSLPRYQINKRFVNLTLLLDKGETEQQRWQRAEDFRFNDLQEVLEKAKEDPALVLLGAPGSGKSTLLRRLQLDHSIDRVRDGGEQVSFFVQLNAYREHANGELAEPGEWLNARWSALYPELPSLESYLQYGRVLLLLDALNEMPHKSSTDYHKLVGLWRDFAQDACRKGNRIVFSCRSLDYSASLSSKELRVPQVEIQPMTKEQVQDFLKAYLPALHENVWAEIDDEKEFSFYRAPYFLKLLCDQVELDKGIPKGRAGLFTGFVRQALGREINGDLFQLEGLLSERDRQKLSLNKWRDNFELPERGMLFPKLADLAFKMQEKGLETEGALVRIDYDDACDFIDCNESENILKAGLALNVLDEDLAEFEITFFHQLLQEYFAARRLAKEVNPSLVHVEWAADKVSQRLEDTIAGLASGDPLPPLPQTGWEETTLTAAPMTRETEAYIRGVIPHNLPLAARCAASPEVNVSQELRRQIQDALIARAQDMKVDLRARISAGEALGEIGDPRFELREGPHGEYLLPPMVEIPGGVYPVGDDDSDYDFEKPAHTVELPAFQIGMFPVTNAEYAKFIAAGGYQNEEWWDTAESLKWIREGGAEGSKQGWRDFRKTLKGRSEESLRDLVNQNRATPEQVEDWLETRNWTDEEFENWLDDTFPSGKLYRQPEFWDDTRFNNPAQPVVGVTWFEARAYCNWLTANVNAHGVTQGVPPSGGQLNDSKARLKTELRTFRLPTEVEFEAAARGLKGRMFPYGEKFEVARCNTFESHIRRSTPVGIFDNGTPEGAFDLSGNVYTWTTSIYDLEKFPYPYRHEPEREDINATEVRRVLRGGSWYDHQGRARAVYRYGRNPDSRDLDIGFRVVSCGGPPSQ